MWQLEREPLALWHHMDAPHKTCISKRLTKLASSSPSLKILQKIFSPFPENFLAIVKKFEA